MPITIDDPVIIPAKEEIVCDKLTLISLNVLLDENSNKFTVAVIMALYGEDQDVKRIYATDQNGIRLTKNIYFSDVYDAVTKVPEIGSGIQGILSALGPMYNYQIQLEKDLEEQAQQLLAQETIQVDVNAQEP